MDEVKINETEKESSQLPERTFPNPPTPGKGEKLIEVKDQNGNVSYKVLKRIQG